MRSSLWQAHSLTRSSRPRTVDGTTVAKVSLDPRPPSPQTDQETSQAGLAGDEGSDSRWWLNLIVIRASVLCAVRDLSEPRDASRTLRCNNRASGSLPCRIEPLPIPR